MNNPRKIRRLPLTAVMMSLVLFAMGAMAGTVPAESNCPADCCQPVKHHSAHPGKHPVTMRAADSCCGGDLDACCDLHIRSDFNEFNPLPAIQPANQPGGLGPIIDRAVRVAPEDAFFSGRVVDPAMTGSRPIPIYLENRTLRI